MPADNLWATLLTIGAGLGLSRNPADYLPAILLTATVVLMAVVFYKFHKGSSGEK